MERLTLWLVGPEDGAFLQYIPGNFRGLLGRNDTVCVGAVYGASACGAALILECLNQGLYPSWDAHTLQSLSLAQKLGYQPAGPYPAYEIT